jgi:hypothetical protein
MIETKNDYVVYGIFLAQYLIDKGFKVKNVGINVREPYKKVYYFENTPQLISFIEEYKTKKQSK